MIWVSQTHLLMLCLIPVSPFLFPNVFQSLKPLSTSHAFALPWGWFAFLSPDPYTHYCPLVYSFFKTLLRCRHSCETCMSHVQTKLLPSLCHFSAPILIPAVCTESTEFVSCACISVLDLTGFEILRHLYLLSQYSKHSTWSGDRLQSMFEVNGA